MEDVEFVREDQLAENHPLRNRIIYELVVKQEPGSNEDCPQIGVDVNNEPRNEAPRWKKTEAQPTKPAPKPIQHRRCSRIEKGNSAAALRHLVRRTQPIVDTQQRMAHAHSIGNIHVAHAPSASSQNFFEQVTASQASTQVANEDIIFVSSTPIESVASQQSINTIHGGIGGNNFPIGSINSLMSYSGEQHAASFDYSSIMHNNAGPSQVVYNAGRAEMANQYETTVSAPHMDTTMDMFTAQYVQVQMSESTNSIFMNAGQEQPTDVNLLAPKIEQTAGADPNYCAVCERTFRSANNLEKHLKTKLHAKKLRRWNKMQR